MSHPLESRQTLCLLRPREYGRRDTVPVCRVRLYQAGRSHSLPSGTLSLRTLDVKAEATMLMQPHADAPVTVLAEPRL